MFPKNSAFGRESTRQQEQEVRRQMRIQREREAADHEQLLPTPHRDEPESDGPPFENWHHDLITIDTLLDQHPPELRRARELLAEVADEIHSQFERVR